MELLTVFTLIMITLSQDVFEYLFEKTGFAEIEKIERKISFNKL